MEKYHTTSHFWIDDAVNRCVYYSCNLTRYLSWHLIWLLHPAQNWITNYQPNHRLIITKMIPSTSRQTDCYTQFWYKYLELSMLQKNLTRQMIFSIAIEYISALSTY